MSAIKARSGGHNLGLKVSSMVYTLRIEEAKQIILRNPGVICAVLKLQKNLKTFCKIIVRCGENVGKMLYKNGLQMSVGHLRVPGAGIEPARIAPLVFETSASTDSAIRAGVLSGCLWARASQEAGA